MIVPAALLVVFLVHLAAFAWLGIRRRQAYYAALVVTFTLLSLTMALRIFAPDLNLVEGVSLASALRVAAWMAAAVSIAWTLTRVWTRRKRAPRRGS